MKGDFWALQSEIHFHTCLGKCKKLLNKVSLLLSVVVVEPNIWKYKYAFTYIHLLESFILVPLKISEILYN